MEVTDQDVQHWGWHPPKCEVGDDVVVRLSTGTTYQASVLGIRTHYDSPHHREAAWHEYRVRINGWRPHRYVGDDRIVKVLNSAPSGGAEDDPYGTPCADSCRCGNKCVGLLDHPGDHGCIDHWTPQYDDPTKQDLEQRVLNLENQVVELRRMYSLLIGSQLVEAIAKRNPQFEELLRNIPLPAAPSGGAVDGDVSRREMRERHLMTSPANWDSTMGWLRQKEPPHDANEIKIMVHAVISNDLGPDGRPAKPPHYLASVEWSALYQD